MFFRENSDLPCYSRLFFRHKILICYPISKLFVALLGTFGKKNDEKILFVFECVVMFGIVKFL